MHIITPYNPWAPKGKKKTWQEKLWEEQQIAEIEARVIAEAKSATLPQNSPDISSATAGPAINAAAGGGGAPPPQYFSPRDNTVSFTPTNGTSSAALALQFINTSAPDAFQFNSWLWNFGDGTTSTEKAPSHQFPTGSFVVGLTGSAPRGAVSTAEGFISASRPDMPPSVTFSPETPISGNVPFTLNLVNTTANYSLGGNTYKWTVSGSTKPVTPVTTSVTTNLSIPIINTGSYAIKLEMTGSWDVTGSTFILQGIAAAT